MQKKILLALTLISVCLGVLAFTNRPSAQTQTTEYREYVAFISQAGTDDPTVTVIYDDIGGTFSWGRYSTGFYSVWSTEQLPDRKTLVLISGARGFIRPVHYPNEVMFYTWNPANALADGVLNNTWLVIRVYK